MIFQHHVFWWNFWRNFGWPTPGGVVRTLRGDRRRWTLENHGMPRPPAPVIGGVGAGSGLKCGGCVKGRIWLFTTICMVRRCGAADRPDKRDIRLQKHPDRQRGIAVQQYWEERRCVPVVQLDCLGRGPLPEQRGLTASRLQRVGRSATAWDGVAVEFTVRGRRQGGTFHIGRETLGNTSGLSSTLKFVKIAQIAGFLHDCVCQHRQTGRGAA